MMAGLLFARAGVRTLVLEKHADFLRDFRGDTLHPSTLDLFGELGLAEALLARPHDRVPSVTASVAGRAYTVADFGHLHANHRFIALMPQWEFLDFVASVARTYPDFTLRTEAEAVGLVVEGERVEGVTLASGEAVRARLVIAADGRRSVLRGAGALPLEDLGAPMDVFWFRLPKERAEHNESGGFFGAGHTFVTIDRGDYWQCAFVFRKGSADVVRARGLEAFRTLIASAVPRFAALVGELTTWDQIKLLSVSVDRLTRWHRPGLLAIGDAAHAMSPIGGVGINLAIQDAVAAANLLASPLAQGADVDPLLEQVQRRRMPPTRVIQALQGVAQRRIIGRMLDPDAPPPEAPLALRLLDRFSLLQAAPARLVGLGLWREHIKSPDAGRRVDASP